MLFVLVSIATRWPTIHAPNLNPDEAQYASLAVYLNHQLQATFAVPHGVVHITGLYQLFALCFGDYSMAPLRIFLALMVAAIAGICSRIVSRVAPVRYGILAGLIVILLSLTMEGLLVNREWFSLFFLMIGSLCSISGIDRKRHF